MNAVPVSASRLSRPAPGSDVVIFVCGPQGAVVLEMISDVRSLRLRLFRVLLPPDSQEAWIRAYSGLAFVAHAGPCPRPRMEPKPSCETVVQDMLINGEM